MFINFHTHRPTAEGVITPRCFGIHPWRVAAVAETDFDSFSAKYISRYQNIEFVGEIGLDRMKGDTYERQQTLLDWQLQIAEERRLPAVIHCVRAYDDILAFRRHYNSTPWVVHGFQGSIEQAQQLWRHRIAVSFGESILYPNRNKLRHCLQQMQTPFFLETDESTVDIIDIYQAAASIRNQEIEQIQKEIEVNYRKVVDL